MLIKTYLNRRCFGTPLLIFRNYWERPCPARPYRRADSDSIDYGLAW